MKFHQPPRNDVRGDVLFIASANPEHVRPTLRRLRASYPDATFDVIARQEALAATADVDGCRVVHVTGTAQGRLGLVRRLRQIGYATVAFIERGDGGYVALQVLSLVLGIRTVVLVDEYGSVIPIRASTALVRHVANRLRKRWQAVLVFAGLAVLRTFLTPIGLLILVARTLAIYRVSNNSYPFLYRRATHRR